MPGSAAVREALRQLDRWTVALWVSAPRWTNPGGGSGGSFSGKGPPAAHAGPMRGVVCCSDDADAFYFLRPNRAAVSLRYSQVVMWEALAPPREAEPPPLPVEEVPRP